MIEACRRKLRSNAPMVVVEAAAGCGKTYQAVDVAVDFAAELGAGQEVLFLAHTHAAVRVFRQRVAGRGTRARALTLDSFAFELVRPYANALGLPVPMRVDSPDGVPFKKLAPSALELLCRAPSVLNALAAHYPVIIFDEHQDARADQHGIASAFARTNRSRVRLFGDSMQAIYDFDGDARPDWKAVCEEADDYVLLAEPKRWVDAPDLGEWLIRARAALAEGGPLPLEERPNEVRVIPAEMPDVHPNSNQAHKAVSKLLHQALGRNPTSLALLVPTRAHAVGVRRSSGRRVGIAESGSLERASRFLEAARERDGDARELALLVLKLVGATCAGCTTDFKRQVEESLLADRIEPGRKKKVLPFLEVLAPLYSSPDVPTWCGVVGGLSRALPGDLKADEPETFFILGKLAGTPAGELVDAFASVSRWRRERPAARSRLISTIHRAKGEEYDHVIVFHVSGKPFPATEEARRMLYVAMTRARRTVTLVCSREAPSPLLG